MNRNLLQPTKANKARRASSIQKSLDKGKQQTSSHSDGAARSSRAPVVQDLIREESSSSAKSGRSQLVDLVVQDHEAEQMERVRARKEGGSAWNEDEAKHFIRAYDDEDEGQDIRQGFDPSKVPAAGASEFAVGEDDEEDEEEHQQKAEPGEQVNESDEARTWAQRDHSDDGSARAESSGRYGNLDDGQVWGSRDRQDEG